MLRAQDEEKSEQKTFPIETLHTVRSFLPRSGVVFFFAEYDLQFMSKTGVCLTDRYLTAEIAATCLPKRTDLWGWGS